MFSPQTNQSKSKKGSDNRVSKGKEQKTPVGPWGLKTEPR